MQVVSGPFGYEKVDFIAPDASCLATEMSGLLRWADDEQPIDPVLKAAIAHFWFVTIHPFEDGHGRIARAIADLFLSRADGTRERYCSMSTQIEAEQRKYYRQRERPRPSEDGPPPNTGPPVPGHHPARLSFISFGPAVCDGLRAVAG
jgi:Fic family protein